MQLQSHTWEHALLSLAYEAQQHNGGSHGGYHGAAPISAAPSLAASTFDAHLLNQAYAYCETMTAHHSRSFYMASSLLPPEARRAVRALYAFCRVSDDIVDNDAAGPPAARAGALERWRALVMASAPPATELVAVAWADARLRYQIPLRYAEQLIDGVAQDLQPGRYETFEDLASYAYGVASTVGLMSMHIIGYASVHAIPYAIKLGVALQLTNILRDVGEDLRHGRVYLPREELKAFGLCEEEMQRGEVSRAWREFMKFQIERNRQLYAEAASGIALLDRKGRFAIAAAANLYRALLTDIEQHDYDVFNRRASISTVGKLRRLPGIWWQSVAVRAPNE